MDRSAEVTLSEGQIPFRDIVPSSNFRTLNFAFSPFSHRYYKTPFPFFWKLPYCIIIKQTDFSKWLSFFSNRVGVAADRWQFTGRNPFTATTNVKIGFNRQFPIGHRKSGRDSGWTIQPHRWRLGIWMKKWRLFCYLYKLIIVYSNSHDSDVHLYSTHKLNKYTSVVFELIKRLDKMITVHRWNDNKECKSLHSHPTPRDKITAMETREEFVGLDTQRILSIIC